MKTMLFSMLLAGAAMYSPAQTPDPASHWEVEIDPIAYILKGFSAHAGYEVGSFGADIGVYAIRLPEGFGGNPGFQVRSQGLGLKLNYLLDEDETWFGGVGFGYLRNRIEQNETGNVQTERTIGVGIHAGYRWFPMSSAHNALSRLYVAPWCSVDYNHPLNDVVFATRTYKHSAISFFPTVHIGYRF